MKKHWLKSIELGMKTMGIQEDIFEGFFRKLEEDKKVPDSIVKGLKTLRENEEISSKEKLLEVIKTGCEGANED